MKTFIIRPYYGHDCNSVDGFNDGHYLNEVEVDADSEDAAIEQCIAKQKTELGAVEYLDHIGDFDTVAWITDYIDEVDEDGNREYLYKYVDFGDVRLKD